MDFSDIEKFEDKDESADRRGLGCFSLLLRFLLVSMALLAATIALLAYALTTDLGRLWLLNKINRSIAPAHLQIAGWKAGVLTPVELNGVEFDSPEQGMHMDCPKIVFSRGVLGLLPLGRLNLGDVDFIEPLVVVDPAMIKHPPKSDSSGSDAGFWMPVADVGGSLYVKKGTLTIKEGGKQRFLVDQVEGKLLVDSFWQPFGFKITCRAGNGQVTVTGDARSMHKLFNGVDSEYEDKLVLQLEKFDLATFAPLLKMLTGRDVLHAGIAEGALTLKRIGLKGAQVEGGVLVDGLQLVTGNGKFSPAGNIAWMIDAQVEDNRWTFKRFDLSSPWLKAQLHGSLQRVNDNRLVAGEITADVDADLVSIARDFKYVLAIDDELKVEQGALKGSFKLSGSSENIRVESDLTCSQIAMLYKGRSIALKRNPSLRFKAIFPRDQMPELEELQFDSSFADIYGKGTIEQGVLKGYFDLTQFSNDFKGLLSSDLVCAGATHFDFSTKPSGKEVIFSLMTKFSNLKFAMKGKGVTSIKSGSLSCGGSVAGASGVTKFKDLDFIDVDFDLRLGESRAHGKFARYVPAREREVVPVLRGGTLNCTVHVRDAVNALGASMSQTQFKEAAGWSGRLLSNLAVESANGIAKARFNGAGSEIALMVVDKKIKDSNLQLSGALTFDANQGTLLINEGLLVSEAARVNIPEWTVHIGNQGEAIKFNGKADATLDIAILYPLLADSANAGYEQARGDLQIKLEAQSRVSGTELGVNATLADFCTLVDNEISFFERKAELTGDFVIANSGKSVTVQALKIYSGLVDLSAKGTFSELKKRWIAVLQGDIDFKFDVFEKLLKVRGVDEWRMTGHKKHPFRLKGPVSEGLAGFLQEGVFSGAAYMASLNGLGLSAGGGDISFALAKSRLQCRWEPPLNGGLLKLLPRFDYSPRGTVMSLPDDIQLLDGVKITQQVVDNLLVLLNPMFHGSTLHSGTLDLKVNSFHSGQDQKSKGIFLDASIVFHNLDMTLSPSMQEILAMINAKEKRYQVQKLPMHIVVRNERVHIDPVTMVFSKQPVTFSGSVGFDSTIKYLIEVPLSEAVAAETGLKIPKGLTVKIPVSGTVDNPRLDTSALENAVGDLIKKTIGEEAMRGVGDFLKQLTDELRK